MLDPCRDRHVLEGCRRPGQSPETLLAEVEERATLLQALAELPSSYRNVLLERADATEPEVARRLGITVANVKIRAHRARKQLRDTLERLERSAA